MTNEDKTHSGAISDSIKIEKCPHCGVQLTQWEQVILSIDRVLTCKHCWYRIILDVTDKEDKNNKQNGDKK